jgi:hypothetical protein
MKVRRVFGVLAMTMAGISAGAGDKITLNASPQISFAPAHLTIRTDIEPDTANRAIEIIIDSPDFYRSTTIDLEGDQAPRTSVFEFRDVPGGVYEVSARLLGQSGNPRAVARRQIDVLRTGREK